MGQISSRLYPIDFDTLPCVDAVYAKNFKSMQLHPTDWEQGYPILNLEGDHTLQFSFDQIESAAETYFYTVVHCTYDWRPSKLMFFEYAEGFEENEITDFEDSQTTFVNYTHFDLQLPNSEIAFTKSGNYLLVIYTKNDDHIRVVATKRFILYEPVLDISGRIDKSRKADYRSYRHELDFAFSRKTLAIYDPYNDIKVVAMQNLQWYTAIYNIPFSFIDNDNIVYDWDDRISFDAGNEYRYFSFNNLDFNTERIRTIEFRKPYYHVDLYTDENNLFKPYSTFDDINGSFIIRTNRFFRSTYPEIQSDYAIVRFSLAIPPIATGNIFINGDFTNNCLSNEFKMTYNLENQCYEALAFLKQGYYNYKYVYVDNDTLRPSNYNLFEGSHFQTENDYHVFVYFRDPSMSYDRLVGYAKFNSAAE